MGLMAGGDLLVCGVVENLDRLLEMTDEPSPSAKPIHMFQGLVFAPMASPVGHTSHDLAGIDHITRRHNPC